MALEVISIIVFSVAVATLLLIANSLRSRNNNKAEAKPPQPPSWPIIGHLPLLSRNKQPIHRFLSSLSDRYGPIMHLRFGLRPVLVIASSDLAKECLTTNDRAFASRPLLSSGKHIGYDFKMLGLAPYGSYWRNIRKICSLQLFTANRIESFRHIREEEISCLIRSLFESWERDFNPVNIKSRLSDLTCNIMMRIVASKRFSADLSPEDFKEVQCLKEVMDEIVLLLGTIDITDYLPFLKWIDPQGIVFAMKNLQKKREVFMTKLLQDHREKRGVHARDLIDVLISTTDNNDIRSDNNDDVVKANALAIIIAGAETSAVTIEWALSALMQNPDVLCKAQQELDIHVGRDRLIEESDMHKLKYLQAIVKETLRLYPAAPLMIPHESVEACTVGGYRVHAGTQLLVNLWAIHRDPAVWKRPTEFDPERFLNSGKEIDVKGQDFELTKQYIAFALERDNMKVVRGERVLIKPCAGEDHRGLVELSNLDLVAYPMYNKVVYVFEAPTPSSEVLKDGLAKVLAEFREWAGRYTKDTPNGCLGINLNDEGVVVIEGEADGTIADAMPFHPSEFLLELVPPTPTVVAELLLMQFTRFSCGGLVIGIASHHHVADGQATTIFMNSWGKMVRGESILPPIHDRSLLKARDPPQPCFDHYEYNNITHGKSSINPNLTIKRFHFDTIFLQKLKSMVKRSNKPRKPYTTFEILVAHMWKCITKARGLNGVIKTKASISVDGRKRINPPLSKEYFGNVVYDSSVQTIASEIINRPLEFIAELIHKSITKVDDNFIHSAIDFFELRKQSLGPARVNDGTDVIPTSWMKFPINSFHFGMGEPIYVGPSLMLIEGLVILFDSYTNFGGVDVVVCLSKEHMTVLEHNYFQV